MLCPWCRAYWPVRPGVDCGKCGGPLPVPAGPDRGPAPPPAPRRLPEPFKKGVMLWKNTFALVGGIFLIVGAATAILLVGVVFLVIGWFMWKKGRSEGERRLKALELGEPAEGEIVDVSMDTSQRINNRHPWRIEYAYDAAGTRRTGSITTFDSNAGRHRPGEPVWVVWVPGAEETSSTWPPLA